ncbi:MAG: PD-(D/E)XK nuclease-like domain-containing protein [Methylobacter sp.]|jgi:hypothetical protein|nr:PD-(D/E)XK nuclease-like domain-containing protein [Methylobacter sp.]
MFNDDWSIPEDLADKDAAQITVETIADLSQITIDMCVAAGASGVDIPNEVYHSLPGISGSNLTLLAESNKHLDNKRLFNLGDSPALVFGTLLHTLVLEPDDVENRYVVIPEFRPKAETGISIAQAEKDFYSDNSDRIIIESNSMLKAERMAKNVRAIAGDIIDKGIKERSLFADLDGVVCKCRLDIDLEDDGDDYDLKSITLGIKEFSDATLEAHIKKLRYHWSAAFRNIIRRHLDKPVRNSYLIFCNTGMGHMVRVVRISPLWIREAEAIVNELLESRRFYLVSRIDDRPVAVIDDKWRKIQEY